MVMKQEWQAGVHDTKRCPNNMEIQKQICDSFVVWYLKMCDYLLIEVVLHGIRLSARMRRSYSNNYTF